MADLVTTVRGGTVVMATPTGSIAERRDVRFDSRGKITEIGPELPHLPGEHVIDAHGDIVLPGLVDSHRHTWQVLMRGLSTDQTVLEYRSLARGRLAARYRPEDVYAAVLLADLQALSGGVTTINDLAHIINSPEHADAVIAAHRDSGLRVVFCHGEPNDLEASTWYHNSSRPHPDDIYRIRENVLDDDEARVTLAIKIRPPFLITPEVLQHDFDMARGLDLQVTMDGGLGGGCWTPARWGDPGLRPVEDLDRIGQLGPHLSLVHCNNLTDSDFRRIGETGTHVSSSPQHEMLCGHGLPAAIRMRKHGLLPALSTDSEVAVTGDMFSTMRSLLTATRGGQSDAAYRSGGAIESWDLRTEDVLRSATLTSAAAIGLAERVGSLEVGKRADLVILRSDPLNLALLNDPVASVVAFAHPGNVSTVIIDGEIVKKDGALVRGDVAQVVAAAEASREHIFEGSDLAAMRRPKVDEWTMFA